MPGRNSHPIFVKKMCDRKGIIGRFRDILSVGGISYYIKSEGIQTRIYIYNYFHLLADENFKSKWEVNLYSRDGKIAKKLTGAFEEGETVVLDTAEISELDDFGVIHTKIKCAHGMFDQPYTTTFFNEYYRPDSTNHGVFAHSLGAPAAIHYTYNRYSSGWSLKSGFRPYMLIGSGCKFNKIGHGKCTRANLTFINYKKEKMSLEMERLRPMESRRLDLFAILPGLEGHLSDKAFSIVIEAENLLSKPYFYQTDAKFLMGEHL